MHKYIEKTAFDFPETLGQAGYAICFLVGFTTFLRKSNSRFIQKSHRLAMLLFSFWIRPILNCHGGVLFDCFPTYVALGYWSKSATYIFVHHNLDFWSNFFNSRWICTQGVSLSFTNIEAAAKTGEICISTEVLLRVQENTSWIEELK